MIFRNNCLACFFVLITFNLSNLSWAEPLIVLEFSSQNQFSEGDGKNAFSMNPNHSENYKVKRGDSVNSILKKFYKGSGLDWRFVQLAIVISNPKAFAKSNPNFLFSGKTLYLPGKSNISDILVGKKINKLGSNQTGQSSVSNIYFFGG